MLNSLLQGIEQRLAKKPFTWMSWWRGKKWISVFLISPTLSEKYPLWKRDEASLSSLRLFDLEPQALHTELQRYWKRPFWQRWWLSLFTSINNKRKAYAYYQRCLAFAEVQKKHGYTGSIVKSSGQERAIFLELVTWFNQDVKQCEKILEQHAGDLNWLQSRFTLILSQYKQKTEQRLLKCMEKKLRKVPTMRSQNRIRNRIKKGSQELGKLMRDYLLLGSFPPDQVSAHNEGATASSVAYEATEDSIVSDSQELVYVGPAVATRNTLRMYSTKKAHLGDMDSVGDWVRLQRQTIDSLLAAKTPEAYAEIKTLLEQSLSSIEGLIKPQIDCYQQLLNNAKQGISDYEVAIEYSEFLQCRLIKFFQGKPLRLLFHPDKSGGNKALSQIKTELFKEFKRLSDTSLEAISRGLRTLKKCIPKWRLEHQAMEDKMQRDREAFRVYFKKAMKESEESTARLNAELAEMGKQIECLNNLVQKNITGHHSSEETRPQDQERPGSSTRSFARR
ncbi:MAG: hypothetical protein CFE62_006970 [Candidatus Aquirickettsiella gammari]|uniref:Uncharacterized protein n=1 Tax=Candidatus Aquirickettsiella gammari TaxID=2016198 RepID=A0A370CF15_9COXI|nr:MAG: hypothetical protein CFE62_006970 [Candidatus Aquirickettsiella gammari]